MAHKKAAGSAKNLRDSNPKYRWLKRSGWQDVSAGEIILRQKWSSYCTWENTYMGKDFTIHAWIAGKVRFSHKKKTRYDGAKYTKTYIHVDALAVAA